MRPVSVFAEVTSELLTAMVVGRRGARALVKRPTPEPRPGGDIPRHVYRDGTYSGGGRWVNAPRKGAS